MLTIELTKIEDTTTEVTITDLQGRTCQARVWSDGSRKSISGAAWLLDKAYNAAGRAGWRSAIQQVRADGRATIG